MTTGMGVPVVRQNRVGPRNQQLPQFPPTHPSAITSPMFRFFRLAFGVMFRLFRRRGSLVLENLVLRQQVSVLKRKNRRPRLAGMDRGLWVAVRQVWPGWEGFAPGGEARNRGGVASSCVPAVLAAQIESQANRE